MAEDFAARIRENPWYPYADRADLIRTWEREGRLDPACRECEGFYAADDPRRTWAPSHLAMSSCRSGRHPHCTCDTCF